MATRYDKTLADYLVIAVSPALIMTLVGSLVFFLLEVFYQGNFTGRLHYILSLFIFAAVLIGRIAIEDGKERAAMFAVPLAGATLLAIVRFVEFQGPLGQASFLINFGLVALIWWCARQVDLGLHDDRRNRARFRRRAARRRRTGREAVGWDQRAPRAHQEPAISSRIVGLASHATLVPPYASRTRRACGSSIFPWPRCRYSASASWRFPSTKKGGGDTPFSSWPSTWPAASGSC